MSSIRRLLSLSLLVAIPAGAQSAARRPTSSSVRRDTVATSSASDDADSTDDEGVRLGFQYGIASGALHYDGGRSEQALGAVLRWAPVRWFSISATPSAVHESSPALLSTLPSVSRSGLVDVPIEAMLTHAFALPLAPTVAGGFGVTLPVGDTTGGFSTGKVGSSISGAVGFTPAERVSVHLGAGRSLSDFSVQSAFTNASGWGDASAGFSLTDRLSIEGGYSTDLGAVDSTYGRSTSLNGGVAIALSGPLTLNVNASHGLSGAAPSWGLAIGVGTAFPYLGHLDGGAPIQLLRNTFGGGTHGLGKGSSGSSTSTGRGRGHL